MNLNNETNAIALVNPFDIRGGASLGTFRLFKYLRSYTHLNASLFVVKQETANTPGLFRSNIFIELLFYSQAFVNRS